MLSNIHLLMLICETVLSPALRSVILTLKNWLEERRNVTVELVLAMQLAVVPADPPAKMVTSHEHAKPLWRNGYINKIYTLMMKTHQRALIGENSI